MGGQLSKNSLLWPIVSSYATQAALAYTFYSFFIKPFLSPLRKIPGPGYNPIFGNVREAMIGEAMQSSISWVKKYGGIVRFYHFLGRERVLIADPAALRHIFVTNSDNYIRAPLTRILRGGIFNVDGEEHAAQRRILNPHFNQEAIKYYISTFADCANALSQFWQDVKCANSTVNVQADLQRMTLDAIGQCVFGYHFNCLKDPDSEISLAFRKITGSAGISFLRLLPFAESLPTAENKEFEKSMKVVDEVIYHIIRQKRRTLSVLSTAGVRHVNGDLLGKLMVARYEETEEGATDEELRNQVISLLIAGHETTSATLSWALLLLAQHPDIQAKVQAELSAEGGGGAASSTISWEYLDRLQYLTAVLKEVQRLYPAAPSVYRRAVKADVICGYKIPANTLLCYHVGALMRNPAVWPEPDEFQPERFLDKEADTSYTYLPFITGPHKCLGHQFAKIEMRTVLAVVLRDFTFQQIPKSKYMRKMRVTLKAEPPIQLRATRNNKKKNVESPK